MKKFLFIITVILFTLPGCKAKYSFNSHSGKKKLNHYNKIPYGYKQMPKTKKKP